MTRKPASGIPASGVPARGYSWKPFGPDNPGRPAPKGSMRHLTHGAKAARIVDPVAKAIADDLMEQAQAPGSTIAYLAELPYAAAVAAWARVEARIALVSTWLQKQGGDLGRQGEVLPAARLLIELEASALKHRSRLGLDPLSRARLGRDIAGTQFDLARLWAAEDEAP